MNSKIGLTIIAFAGMGALASPAQAREYERLTVDVEALLVAADGRTSDGFENQDRSGVSIGGDAEFDIRRDEHRFRVGAGSRYITYYDDEEEDDHYTGVWLTYSNYLSRRVRVDVQVRHDFDLTTLESSNASQSRIRSGVRWSQGPHRVRLRGGYRWREYDNDDTHGEGFEAATDYRYRFYDGSDLVTYIRYDENDAEVDRRDYRRWTFGTGIEIPLSRDLEIGGALRYRMWRYPERLTDIGEVRHDSSVNPALTLTYDAGNDWEFEARGDVIWRRSNDNEFDETIKRVGIGVSKRFRTDL
ncbi:hypothetical protein [Sphingomicrobium lutaoense]|uniref:DUF481 domain-containing protein n=1 Tax=Sphingomicrobium lutaoense TaxID=515949 RepID=A0A839Z2S0_9SPHN|nr:hypothetical protein [Sphingomicrobium lutaoense]MBB3764053.1 hypothetical protein [Sphingomicrobium lutaoense]